MPYENERWNVDKLDERLNNKTGQGYTKKGEQLLLEQLRFKHSCGKYALQNKGYNQKPAIKTHRKMKAAWKPGVFHLWWSSSLPVTASFVEKDAAYLFDAKICKTPRSWPAVLHFFPCNTAIFCWDLSITKKHFFVGSMVCKPWFYGSMVLWFFCWWSKP